MAELDQRVRPAYDGPLGATPVTVPVIGASLLLWSASAAVVAVGVAREFLAFTQGTASVDFPLLVLSLNHESSIPAWYSSTQLLLCALILFLQAWRAVGEHSRQWSGWLILAFGFVYLSLDEASSIHEIIGDKIEAAIQPTGFFAFGWVLIGIPAVALVVLSLRRFILQLPRTTQLLFLASGFVYILGAIGFEMLGASISGAGVNAPGYMLVHTFEEILEIFGISLFLTSLLVHARQQQQGWLLRAS